MPAAVGESSHDPANLAAGGRGRRHRRLASADSDAEPGPQAQAARLGGKLRRARV